MHRLFQLQRRRATPKQVNKGKRVVRLIGWSNERENTVPFVAWNTRNFKPEYLVEWKAPPVMKQAFCLRFAYSLTMEYIALLGTQLS